MSQFIIKNREKIVSNCQKLIDEKISGKNLNSEKFNFEKNVLKELNVKNKEFNSEEEFDCFFKLVYEKCKENLTEQIKKYNKDLLIFCLVNLESLLFRVSYIKLNGEFNYGPNDKENFPKFTKNIEIVERFNDVVKYKLFLNDVNTNVGFYKKGIDVVTNLILSMDNIKGSNKINKYKLHTLIFNACQLWHLYTLLKIPYNDNEINCKKNIFIKDFKIYHPESNDQYIEAAVNYAFQDFFNGLDKEVFEELCDLYEKKLKYSPRMLIEYYKNVKNKDMPQIFSMNELKEFCTMDSLPLEGFEKIFDDIVLKPNSKIFDKNDRISKKGIIQVSNDKYIFTLSNKIKNPNFSNNKKIIKFIQKKIAEKWLMKLQKRLLENDIWFELNQNVSNNIVDDNIKKVSKEIDLLLYNKSNNTLMIIEYKNWEKNAYDSREIDKEIKKIEKHVKKRVKLIKSIENSMDLFLSDRSKVFDINPKLELFIIFEERNVLCNKIEYFNNQTRVSYFSVSDFESYIFKNAKNFQK